MEKAVKIILSILLFTCLADMPYGYYEFVRFACLLGFSLLAYNSYKIENNNLVIVYISLALLFQPFIKIALGRFIWNIVDVIVAAGLILSLIIKNNSHDN
ncbi:hypothetical protein LB456_09025 [Psychroflexus sp. CAK57W]|uniref:DUF6804 family protein n=1 Tax=Psychroflexus curvus TaxID=2873595 RepID=UPI001CCC3C7A|nr:DUF6804 family protein [Psychroflexus curvus]MBZ9787596.1 hypothetical protein [Psychroflexus curvus]